MKKIYVGNLPPGISESNLREIFSKHGTVKSAKLVKDQYTDKPRGFGFVEMPDDKEALVAIDALNKTEIDGRSLKVSESKTREERGSRGRGPMPKLW